MDALQRAVIAPAEHIVIDGAFRGQILRQRAPLAPRTEDIHDAVDDTTNAHPAPVAAGLRGRDQWADQRPFLISQVTRIPQFRPVISTTIVIRPHLPTPANRIDIIESQVIPTTQDVSGWTLTPKAAHQLDALRRHYAKASFANDRFVLVVPAKAGIHGCRWIPAFAGMTT